MGFATRARKGEGLRPYLKTFPPVLIGHSPPRATKFFNKNLGCIANVDIYLVDNLRELAELFVIV